MFGLPQTRKAVAAMIRASAVKGRLAADSPMNQSGGIASAERDGSVDENVSEDSADVDGSVESLASQRAWTPPEALGTETAAAEGTKGFQKEDDQKAGEAADSYALGMIAWEVSVAPHVMRVDVMVHRAHGTCTQRSGFCRATNI